MFDFVRNPEWKSVAVKVVALQLLLAVSLFFYMNHQMETVNKALVNQQAALMGHFLKGDPSMEKEVIRYITQGAQDQDVAEGKRILAQYGYTETLAIEDQPVLAHTALPLHTALPVLVFTVPLLLVLLWEYRGVFAKVRTISVAAEQVVEHQFAEPLPEGEEGDFGSLGRSFNAMADRLSHSLEQLQQEKTFLRELLSDISHQLKTPLASLIVFHEHLLNDPKMGEETRRTFLERSRDQLDRMEWLITSLLKSARVEAGAILYRKKTLRLRDVIDQVVDSLRVPAEHKKLTLAVRGGEELLLEADEEWLAEAFINLVKNALEHSPTGGTIEILLEENTLFLDVAIRDQGEGIPPEDLPHIFKRFYKGRSQAKPQSVGIGLSLSKSIIEGQGGMITVSSQVGDGSEFRVSFMKGSL
ncbi:HAMP domain-containing sensor histidine kinase [Gorillibacterium sp. CAU 1737]|uniref:HAMP domain-containing sensor histidine kinase n=1 Tax=Gorillibacterium sp. CAU 1737 TaxID=3140362 RepID=UPI0032616E33